ncbi:sulfotransferase family protein [Primorskyibacter sedentarius]|uniref:sulfotransferase family protein n=1 Tax=Primorskyibacter sedentarius TaxID=745311 RepID=UPI003EBA7350
MTQPIFIYGALRSGTTLFRLMLNSHEGLKNPGEVDFLFDFLQRDPTHPTGWRYRRDEMICHRIVRAHDLQFREDLDGLDLLRDLIAQFDERGKGRLTMNVHRHADLIAEVLPDARYIHLLRDPRDVARSSIGMGWAGNSYHGVTHWIRTEMEWREAPIPRDAVFELRFEDLMSDIEAHLTNVCSFLGVPFSEVMLGYHLDTTYGPPDPKISQQWKRKASSREIALIEGRLGTLLTDYGYVPNGPPAFPRFFEKTRIGAANRLGRWRFNIRRFGLPLYLSSHFTKRFGPKWLDRKFRLQMDKRVIKALK